MKPWSQKRQIKSSQLAPFPCPSPLAAVRLQKLVELAVITFERGWNPGTAGNFSIRQDDELVWQSPSGVLKGQLQASQFLPIHLTSALCVNPEAAKASDETPLHLAIYRADPTARAVMHVHSPNVIRSSRQSPLEFCQQEIQKAFGEKTHDTKTKIPVIDNTQDMIGLAKKVKKHLDLNIKILILREHGVYAWGREPDEAFHRLEALEFLCKTQK